MLAIALSGEASAVCRGHPDLRPWKLPGTLRGMLIISSQGGSSSVTSLQNSKWASCKSSSGKWWPRGQEWHYHTNLISDQLQQLPCDICIGTESWVSMPIYSSSRATSTAELSRPAHPLPHATATPRDTACLYWWRIEFLMPVNATIMQTASQNEEPF